MIFEVCTDSVEGTILAKQYGAKRVELCSALSVGGLTPSISLVEECVQIRGVEVHAMIRHTEGWFVYTPSDISIMRKDIEHLAKTGVHGVVFGCLTNENTINYEQNEYLLNIARNLGLEVTFHRAFDFVNNPFKALEQLIDLGFDRLLTSGQKPTAIEGINLIDDLVKKSNGRIQIMAGSGVNPDNAKTLAHVGVNALHFTSHRYVDEKEQLGMGQRTYPDEQKISRIVNQF